MAEEERGSDGLTQRERRAARHRSAPRERAPISFAARARPYRGPAIIALIVVAGAAFIWYSQETSVPCPGHWHATFAAFTPDADGAPKRIDWHSPQDPLRPGQPYYNFGNDPNMGAAVHMHQSGAEQGSEALGPAQFHFEGNKCVGVETAFNTVDLDVSPGHMAIKAGSPLAQINGVGPWNDLGNQTLRFFVESRAGNGTWVWGEQDLGSFLHTQLRDGESVLLAYGHYDDAQIAAMEHQVPAPISRVVTPTSTSASGSGTATMTDTATGTATDSSSSPTASS